MFCLLGGSQAWWCIPIIPGLDRLKQENPEFENSLSYISKPDAKKKRKKKSELQGSGVVDGSMIEHMLTCRR
jgi:hypothetical protein